MILNGWISIASGSNGDLQQSVTIFQEALEKNKEQLELLVGLYVATEKLKKFT